MHNGTAHKTKYKGRKRTEQCTLSYARFHYAFRYEPPTSPPFPLTLDTSRPCAQQPNIKANEPPRQVVRARNMHRSGVTLSGEGGSVCIMHFSHLFHRKMGFGFSWGFLAAGEGEEALPFLIINSPLEEFGDAKRAGLLH